MGKESPIAGACALGALAEKSKHYYEAENTDQKTMLTHVLLHIPHNLERVLPRLLGKTSANCRPASRYISRNVHPHKPWISYSEHIVIRRGVIVMIQDTEFIIHKAQDLVALDAVEFKGIVAWVLLVLDAGERETLEIDSRVEIPVSTHSRPVKGDRSSIYIRSISAAYMSLVLDNKKQNMLLTSGH